MNDHLDTATQSQSPATKAAGRRRFLGAGAGAAPVLLTLASQPALATTCFTPSRALSANMSAAFTAKQTAAAQNFTCHGNGSVQYYRLNQGTGKWPANIVPATAKFSDFFSGGDTRLLKDILSGSSTSVEAAFIAALFNIRGANASVIPANVLDESKLKTMWTEFKSTGKYQLYAGGPQWNGTGLRDYLRNNYIIGTAT